MRYSSKKNKKHQTSYKVRTISISEIKIVGGGGYGKPQSGCINLKLKKKDIKSPIVFKGGGFN